MRVSAETKAATRQAILETSRRLFGDKGFEGTTTRDIAEAVGIASGTLFNYFRTKEGIVAELVGQAAEGASSEGAAGGAETTLEEALFSLAASTLRTLRPFRKYVTAMLETSLSPLSESPDDPATSLRVRHLEAVVQLAAHRGVRAMPQTALHLYWTLFIGVIAFWSTDASANQEETLALLDDSTEMFANWLRGQDPRPDEQ